MVFCGSFILLVVTGIAFLLLAWCCLSGRSGSSGVLVCVCPLSFLWVGFCPGICIYLFLLLVRCTAFFEVISSAKICCHHGVAVVYFLDALASHVMKLRVSE